LTNKKYWGRPPLFREVGPSPSLYFYFPNPHRDYLAMTLELKHPAELNPWQTYRQAKKLAKHSSRAKNADWYSGVLELGRQWHLWYDGETMVSAVYDRDSGQWHEGPSLPEFSEPDAGGVLTELEPAESVQELHEILKTLLAGKEIGGKARSLGVVFHLADDFTLADISPEYAVDQDYDAVNELLILDPELALGDQSIDSLAASWRALPYWGVHEGEKRSVAVQVSRANHALISEIRSWGEEHNIPVIASAISAPLEALRLATLYIEWSAGAGDMILLQYRRFSAFAVLGQGGELMLMRALPHVGDRSHPSRLGETLVNTAASMNLVEPRVHILPMGDVSTDDLVTDLGQFFANRPALDIGVIELDEIEGIPTIPGGRMEMIVGQDEALRAREEGVPLAETETFTRLAESWATQDFYGLSEYEKAVYPERKDLKLLKVAGIAKLFLLVITVGLAGWTGFEYLQTARTEAWKLDAAEAAETKVGMQALKKTNDEAVYWENVMTPRAEGWLVLEALLDLFPADCGLLVTDYDFKILGTSLEKDADEVGFRCQWKVKGYARSEGSQKLSQLSSKRYLSEEFQRIGEEFSSQILLSDDETRSLEATMQQRQGQLPSTYGLPASVARHYRTSFELTISQEFDNSDTLALTAKPPFE